MIKKGSQRIWPSNRKMNEVNWVECPKCGNAVSRNSKECPTCQTNVKAHFDAKDRNGYGAIVIFVLCAVYAVYIRKLLWWLDREFGIDSGTVFSVSLWSVGASIAYIVFIALIPEKSRLSKSKFLMALGVFAMTLIIAMPILYFIFFVGMFIVAALDL
jgi:endogenous inhibitor of DNA gyrase (YacG/DUF329 family)